MRQLIRVFLIISTCFLPPIASAISNDFLRETSIVFSDEMGVSFNLEQHQLDFFVDETEAIKKIPDIQKKFSIMKNISNDQITQNPIYISGLYGEYITQVILKILYEKTDVNDLHVTVYLSHSGMRKNAILTFNINRNIFDNWSHSNLNLNKFIHDYTVTKWFLYASRNEPMVKTGIVAVPKETRVLAGKAKRLEILKNLSEPSVHMTGMLYTLHDEYIEITFNQKKSLNAVTGLQKVGLLHTTLSQEQIKDNPFMCSELVALTTTEDFLSDLYSLMFGDKFHIAVYLDKNNTGKNEKILLFTFDITHDSFLKMRSSKVLNENLSRALSSFKFSQRFLNEVKKEPIISENLKNKTEN